MRKARYRDPISSQLNTDRVISDKWGLNRLGDVTSASLTQTLGQPPTHQPRARSRAVQGVPWASECSDVRVISFPG